jgi:hypothetical protein
MRDQLTEGSTLTTPSRSRWLRLAAVMAFAALVPAAASAQSQFAGRVTDTSGAVLPGVTVEAASPALIERVRSVVTDGQGRYTITDLRPGAYTLKFELTGFATVVRDGINLPADFTMTINGELRVGGIEETLTVTGSAPVVDVTQAQQVETLSREALDSLPTGRTLQARAALVPLVTSAVDVGGSQGMDQFNMRLAGTEDNEATVFVDGMLLNSNSSDGASQYYFNDAMAQQVSIQTSGVDAETQAGGVRINLVPKDGGNTVKGSMYLDGANEGMMSSNLTQKLKDEGVDSVDSLHRVYDFNGSIGGPIKHDRLWFLFTGHRKRLDQIVLGSFYPDGSPGINDVVIHAVQLRLTAQLGSKHKVAGFYDANNKVEYHSFSAGQDIATAATTRGVGRRGPRYAAQLKWTGTFSSKLLAEAGWGTNRVDYINKAADESRRKERPGGVRTCVATPCLSFDPMQVGPNIDPWYTLVSHSDPNAVVTRWNYINSDFHKVPQRYVLTGKVTYVTGSNNLKVGIQNSFGPENWSRIINGDLAEQAYRGGIPDTAVVYNTPMESHSEVTKDLGIYAQDSFTQKRLTISPGVRLEWFDSQVNDEVSPAGRFVAARNFQGFKIEPRWFDVSPRLGLAMDVFGDAKTALKFDIGKYVHALSLSLADRYNPLAAQTDRRLWGDCYRDGPGGLTCSGANPYGTNGDDIVQDWEVGPSGISNFGSRITTTADPDIKRDYYVRTGLGIQHELRQNLGVQFGWYHTSYRNMRTYVNNLGVITPYTVNTLRSLSDYTAFQVANPLAGYEGQKVTVYNLDRSKLSAVQNIDTNVAKESGLHYNGFVLGMDARVKGVNVFTGLTIERQTTSFCDTTDNPNQLRFCDTTGGKGEQDTLSTMKNAGPSSGFSGTIPYKVTFKMGGDFRLPFDVQVSAALRSLAGDERIITWVVPVSAFTAAGLTRTQSLTVRLNEPGSLYYDRLNIADVGLGKWLQFGHLRTKLGANIYNLLNPDTVTGRTNAYGATLGDPTGVILGRFWKASLQLEW